uniref:histone acetyltransferase n=1 Tax=Ditylenchus dipsaci TaxID=166011 RepID=A0A915DMM8_9BILA
MINKLVEVEPKLNESSSNIRNESVKKCINSIVHACQCRDANCGQLNYHKMKRVVAHTKICKKRQISSNSCPACKQLIAICCYHAKHCSLDVCPRAIFYSTSTASSSCFSKTGVDNLQMHADAEEDKMYDWQQQRNAFLSKIAQHFSYSEQNMMDTSQIKHFSSSKLMSQQMLVQHPQPAPYQQNSQCNQRVDQQIVGLSDLQLQESAQGNRKQVTKRKVSEDESSDEKLLSGLTTLFKTVLGSGGSQEDREEQQFGQFVASSLSNLGDDDVKDDAMVEIQQVLQTAKKKIRRN